MGAFMSDHIRAETPTEEMNITHLARHPFSGVSKINPVK
jgi:hypothetical protein